MAHSRLEKIGTIYSRVTGLIRAGAMKLEDRPLWYEVYQKYPPEVEPRFDRPVPDKVIREIFYPEDAVRAKFHQRLSSELPPWDLTSKEQSVTQRMISVYQKLESESGLGPDEAFDKAVDIIREEGLLVKPSKEARQTKQIKPKDEPQPDVPPVSLNIKNIFKS